MAHKHMAATAGIVTALTMTLIPAGTASADTPHCVTRSEFDRAVKGMSKARVHRIFDTRGFFIDGAGGGYVRGYQRCRRGNPANVEYYVTPAGRHQVSMKRWRGAIWPDD